MRLTLLIPLLFLAVSAVSWADERECELGWAIVSNGTSTDAAAALRAYDGCLKGRTHGEARASALQVRGTLLASEKRWEEARADFEEAISNRSKPDIFDFLHLSNAYLKLGRHSEACGALDQAERVSSESSPPSRLAKTLAAARTRVETVAACR